MVYDRIPPTKTEIAYHAKGWNGIPFHDVCGRMIAGRLVIVTGLPGYRTYDVYASTITAFVSSPKNDGTITIESDGGPPYTGRVCVGIMDENNLITR